LPCSINNSAAARQNTTLSAFIFKWNTLLSSFT